MQLNSKSEELIDINEKYDALNDKNNSLATKLDLKSYELTRTHEKYDALNNKNIVLETKLDLKSLVKCFFLEFFSVKS
jgi:hypothetical protein